VIIPTYNRAALLLQAITSVRQQTWPHIQIIVADDGSTDDTEDLVSGMRDVLYVRQERRGQGAARNLGLRYAEGPYICTLDSDDLWKPDFVENGLRALRALNADFAFSNWLEETPDGQRHTSSFEEEYGWSAYRETELNGWRLMEPTQSRAIYVEACISPSSALIFSKDLITDGWNEDLTICDDWHLLLNWVLSRPCRVAVSTQPQWVKRFPGDNISEGCGDKSMKLYAYLYDSKALLQEFSPRMRKDEGARFYALIALYQFRLCKLEFHLKRFGKIPGLLLQSAGEMTRALILWPKIVTTCAHEIRKPKRKISSALSRVSQAQCFRMKPSKSRG
jgi:glycosyltransferase involved in cell wall biosynthesis